MSLRLRLASRALPSWTARRLLGEVALETTEALDRLLETHSLRDLPRAQGAAGKLRGCLAARRRAMAAGHNARVRALIQTRGEEEGLRLAREALFAVGVRLGESARRRLGVKDRPGDLLLAARVLYRVLGIRFGAAWISSAEVRVRIDRCALASSYTREACLALSAADEGVVTGLHPGARFSFEERITEGRPACLARIELPKGRG